MNLLIMNVVLFQLGWFACVLGGASQVYTWAGSALAILIVVAHVLRAQNISAELILVLLTMLLGTLWDSGLFVAGLYQFNNGVIINGIAPYWLIAMWALFATTLNISMRWMRGRYLLAALFGGIGGPCAYYAGHRLGAVEFSSVDTTLMVIAIGWSLIMPLLVYMTRFFNGYAPAPAERMKVDIT